mgnify:CR=1 FL=1
MRISIEKHLNQYGLFKFNSFDEIEEYAYLNFSEPSEEELELLNNRELANPHSSFLDNLKFYIVAMVNKNIIKIRKKLDKLDQSLLRIIEKRTKLIDIVIKNKKYKKDIKASEHPILDSLVEYALKYFKDIVQPNKKHRKPNEKEKKALQDLVNRLNDCKDQMDPEAIQTIVYSVGKDNGYKENLREWFKAIYEIIFGDQDGPRMGFFISFFGIKETIELINKCIK